MSDYVTEQIILHFDNDEGLYTTAREISREIYEENGAGEVDWSMKRAVADRLQDEIRESIPDEAKTGVSEVLLDILMKAADWDEVAGHYLEDVAEES